MKDMVQIDDKLHQFNELVLRMLTRVETSLLKAIVSFRDNDVEMAKKVISEDQLINQMRSEIENSAIKFLISEAPYAHYMRYVIAGLKMATSLERIGDHAWHLARVASNITVKKECELPIIDKIVEMANTDAQMFRNVIVAFSETNTITAREIAKMDNKVDHYKELIYLQIFDANKNSISRENFNLFEFYYLAKELERLGDHITTICEWIVYIKEGEKPQLNK